MTEYNRPLPGTLASVFHMNANTPTDELQAAIAELMTYHPWDEEQIAAGKIIVKALSTAIEEIVRSVPSSASRTIALQHLVDARLRANAAITFKGKY